MTKKSLIPIICFFVGCVFDSMAVSEMVNQSGASVFVEIQYDRKFCDSVWEYDNNKLRHFIYDKGEATGFIYSFDTVQLISRFKVPPGGVLRVGETVGGPGIEPDYSLIKAITITAEKRTSTYPRALLNTLFIPKDKGKWQLIIDK